MREVAEINRQNWMLGIYIQRAIASCFDKQSKYPSEPLFQNQLEEYEENISLTQEEIEEKEIRKMIELEDLEIARSSNLPVPKLL